RGPSPVLSTDTDLGHGYVRRDGAIHFIGGGVTGSGANATRIDTPSPWLLRKVVMSKFGPFKTADGLDVASFNVLCEEYTRDKNHVYYKVISNDEFIVIVLPDADPASFELLGGELARDHKRVWYRDEIQHGVDAATIERIEGGPVTAYKDKNSVFYQYDAIAGADPASFKHIGAGYYADNKRVYWGPTPVPGADPSDFTVMGDSFIAKDSSRIYRSGEPLPGYDVASFELILHNEAGFQIFSDKNGIHIDTMTFPRSKPGKIEIIDKETVLAGDLIHLVNTYQYTPVTLFKESGKLMAETPVYEPESEKVTGMMTAEVTSEGLKDIRISPLPGGNKAPSVPEWQLRVFKEMHLVQRMIRAGSLIPSQLPQ
ncbi:MAG: DKNYY domain-containing protein, partial [Akkermansiaceae bacterium]|nr:DKNYY domain-containing protein [Akkermansiaceae bacterium]